MTVSSGVLFLVSQLPACLLFSDLDTEEALLAATEIAFARCRAGEEQLIEGVQAREGDVCGCEGTLVCGIDGALTCIGESEPNDCGGCGALPGVEG